MSLLTRVKSFFGFGGVNPTMEGGIPVSWPVNWWQKNYQPHVSDANSTVNGCVDAYAQTIASIPIRHLRRNSKGGKDVVDGSAFNRLMKKPNAYQTRSDLNLNMIRNLLFTGNAYLLGVRGPRNDFAELHLMPSTGSAAYIEPETKTIFYGFGANPLVGDLTYLVPQRDVLHLRLHCPHDPLTGVSPIVNAALAISSNNALLGHQATFFNNMSRPSGFISTDQVLQKDQLLQLRAAWHEQSQNLNSGGVPVLAAGMKFQSLSLTSEDAQLVEAYHMTVEDIARAFRIPLPLIGDLRNSTYNNVEQLISSWLATGLGFLLEHIELSYSNFFALDDTDCIESDTKSLLRTDLAGRIDALTKGISGGLYSINEARRQEGLPSVEFGDEPRVQAQVVPLSAIEIPPSAQTPTANNDEQDNEEERAFIAANRLKSFYSEAYTNELAKVNAAHG